MCSSRMPVVVLVSAFIDLTGPATRISGQSVSTTTFASCADQIREIIGDYFACDGWVGKDVLYVDDDGLYKPNAYFIFQGCGQELFPDIGVVAGTDDRGEIMSAVTTLDDLKQRIYLSRRTTTAKGVGDTGRGSHWPRWSSARGHIVDRAI
jgi:hypothetical protein